MKRLYLLAAVAGLWPGAALRAQEGLAPTAPVVPAPVLQNGKILTPEGGWGGSSAPRLGAIAKWSPFRNPATASFTEPTAPVYQQAYQQPLPPLPTGISSLPGTPDAPVPEANCGPSGCGKPKRDRSCWARLKAFLCYHDSPTGLPKCQPTPYVGPIQGMFPCTAAAGCVTPCGSGPVYGAAADAIRYGVPNDRQPPAYVPPPPGPVMPPPVAPGPTTAGPVMMPARGMQASSIQPTVQGRVVPESAVSVKPAAAKAVPVKTAPGTIVPTGYLRPAPK